ncbi:MAG: hypothetical protein ACP6IY_09840 [Promethearchaeia archaeon]
MSKSWLKYFVSFLYLLITIGYCFLVYYTVVIKEGIRDIVPIIRGSASSDLAILFTGIPIIMIFLLIFAKIFAYINFKIMSRFQLSYHHFIINIKNKNISTSTFLSRVQVPMFLSLALSLLINSNSVFWGFFGIDPISSIIFLSLILAPLSFILILPIWIFQDCGIIKLRKKSDNRVPPKLIYFGSFQYQSYRGFAGITTPIMYFLTIYSNLAKFNIIALIILIYPLILPGFFIPALLIYDKMVNKLSEKFPKWLKLPELTGEIIENYIFDK